MHEHFSFLSKGSSASTASKAAFCFMSRGRLSAFAKKTRGDTLSLTTAPSTLVLASCPTDRQIRETACNTVWYPAMNGPLVSGSFNSSFRGYLTETLMDRIDGFTFDYGT